MTLILKQLFSFFTLLNSDTGHNQIAAGLCAGIILGFSPVLSLQTFIVFLLLFFLRIQIGAAFLAAFFFKFVAWIIDPIADSLGRAVLESDAPRPLFVTLYNAPLVPLTRFNNSIVMGSMIIGLILAIPGYFIFRTLILHYRLQIVSRFAETRVWKAWKATKIYGWYSTYQKLYL